VGVGGRRAPPSRPPRSGAGLVTGRPRDRRPQPVGDLRRRGVRGEEPVQPGQTVVGPQAKTTTSSTPHSSRSAANRASDAAASAGSTGRPTASASSWTTVSASCSGVWRRPAWTTSIPASRRPRATVMVARSSPSSPGVATTTRIRSRPGPSSAVTGQEPGAAARPAP
jgi:hypothetical protein